MRRKSIAVVSELLQEKRNIVRNYPELVRDTGDRIDDLIDGTAVFPGGTGLWHGANFWAPIPDLFPESPIMFVGHNFDSQDGHQKSKERGGELQSLHTFWGVLLAYLEDAGITPEGCFFTNALMGLKPGSATGSMPPSKIFESQCLDFLNRQIQIVRPSLIVSLGGEASKRVCKTDAVVPGHKAMHPSAREFKPLVTRKLRIRAQGLALRDALRNFNLGGID